MNAADAPTVAVLLPCCDDADHLPQLLAELLPQLEAVPGWCLVAVDDASADATGSLLDEAAARSDQMQVLHGEFGSPGAARSAAAAAVTVLGRQAPPDWLLSTDCDVDVPEDFVAGWVHRLAQVHDHDHVGALNGGEEHGHLLDGLPHAHRASMVFGMAANRAEAAVGLVNLNGANHAVRTSAYLVAGPYVQPTVLGPSGVVDLAGEDWDLGVRLRLAGYDIAECGVSVRTRGRRLLADLPAFLSGAWCEGAVPRGAAGGPLRDLDPEAAAALTDPIIERVLTHFFFKIVLACPGVLDEPIGLGEETVVAMRAWMERWPSPTFAESRNGFLHGRLPRFAATFLPDVRRQLGLSPRSVTDPVALEG